MKIRKAYKFRLKPTTPQQSLLTKFAGHTRFLWNKALSLNLARLKQKQRILYYQELNFWSLLWKQSDEYGFLKECPAHILQQKLRDLERAFKDAFDKKQRHKRLPVLKKRGNDSFRFPAPKQIQLEHQHMTFPKLGRMRFYRSQAIVGDIRNYTLSYERQHWYVSVQVEQELMIPPVHANTSAIGIDLGVKHFLTTSNGEQIAPVNSFKQLAHQLAIKQRRLSKKKKFSRHWQKASRKVNKLHTKIANIRKDFQHKLSTTLCKNHAMIVVEELKIKNMSRSAKGSLEAPGKKVRAKSGLNKSILDQGWSEFKRQLAYKATWLGGLLIEVSPKHTSQQCAKCGYIDKQNRLTQENFACMKCHHSDHADRNAAKNILAAGHAVLACGASAIAQH